MKQNYKMYAAAMLAACSAVPTFGANDTWVGGSGLWSVGSNWSLGSTPAGGDSALLTQTGAVNRDVTLNASTPTLSGLTVDATGGGQMTLTVSAGTLSVSGSGSIEFVGNTGTGKVVQTGGSHVINGNLRLGNNAGSNGTYGLSGGTASASNVYVGGGASAAGGTGTLSIGGSGAMTVSGTLKVWDTPGSALNLTGGTLSVGTLDTSNNAAGRFNWTGGTLAFGSDLRPTAYNVGKGVDLPAGKALTVGGILSFAVDSSVNLAGGTLSVGAITNSLNPGGFTWTAGALTINSVFTPSAANVGASPVISAGKTLTVLNNALSVGSGVNVAVTGGNVAAHLMQFSGGGRLNLSDGTASAVLGEEINGGGSFTQTGGTNTSNGYIYVGSSGTAGGTYTLSGGTATAASVAVGLGGSGTLSISGGGTLTSTGTLTVYNTAGSGVNLGGGTLSVGSLNTSSNPGRFNWTGGMLTVTGTSGLNVSTLGSSLTLDATRTLGVTNMLTLPSGTNLTLGGGTLTTGSVGVTGATVTQTGGTHAGTAMYVGYTGNGGGGGATYALSDGTLTVNTWEQIGAGSNGTFVQTGGTNTAAGPVDVGSSSGSTGVYSLSGGTLTGDAIDVGNSGSGTFGQAGGSVAINKQLTLGKSSGSAAGVYTLSGGSLDVGMSEYLGNSGSGAFIQTGGTHTTRNGANWYLAFQSGSSGTYTLSGGKASVGNIYVGGSINGIGGVGNLNVGGTGDLTASGTLTVWKTPGTSVNVTGGTLAVHAIQVNGTYAQTGGTATLGAATVSATGSLTATRLLADSLSVSGVASLIAGSGASRVGGLSVSAGGRLDLSNNQLIVDYDGGSPLAGIVQLIASGYGAGGHWDGTAGITSTAAMNDPKQITGLGYAEASEYGAGTFAGETIGGNAVLIKYTYYGDVNLDGRVNADDYAMMDRAVAKGLAAAWTTGDFNYDGSVNAADWFLMDKAFGVSNGGLSPGLLGEREARFGEGYVAELVAAVPEPGVVGMVIGVAALGVGRRRRR